MNKEDYKLLVKKHTSKEPKLRNFGVAFLVGGLIGLLAEVVSMILKNCFAFSSVETGLIVALFVIGVASFLQHSVFLIIGLVNVSAV